MDSATKDELKINTSALSEDRPTSRLKTPEEMEKSKYSWQEITNYDEMLKDFIIQINESCEAILTNLENHDMFIAAYNIGLLHKTASNAIEKFGIEHLFKEADND